MNRIYVIIPLLTILFIALLMKTFSVLQDFHFDESIQKLKNDLGFLRSVVFQHEELHGRLNDPANLKEIASGARQFDFKDPWGNEYQINAEDGIVYSYGPNGDKLDKSGWISSSFRPPLSLSESEAGSIEEKSKYFSLHHNGGFSVKFYFSRAIKFPETLPTASESLSSIFVIRVFGPDYNERSLRVSEGLILNDRKTVIIFVSATSFHEVESNKRWILDIKNGNCISFQIRPKYFSDRLGGYYDGRDEVRFLFSKVETCYK